MGAVVAGPVLAAEQILGLERGAFAMLVMSAIVLLLGIPVAARLGTAPTVVFRRTSIVYGAVMLVLLFGTFLVVKEVH